MNGIYICIYSFFKHIFSFFILFRCFSHHFILWLSLYIVSTKSSYYVSCFLPYFFAWITFSEMCSILSSLFHLFFYVKLICVSYFWFNLFFRVRVFVISCVGVGILCLYISLYLYCFPVCIIVLFMFQCSFYVCDFVFRVNFDCRCVRHFLVILVCPPCLFFLYTYIEINGNSSYAYFK